MRKDLLDRGVTQMSACSAVGLAATWPRSAAAETGEIDPTLTAPVE